MIDSGYSEEFLAWMNARYNTAESKAWWVREVLENSLGRFMFEAWQASRANLVIALPEGGYFAGYDNAHMMDSRDVREALEGAGVKVK